MRPHRRTLRAPHCCVGDPYQKGGLEGRNITNALGIKYQSASTLFVILGQVNFQVRFLNIYVFILLVEVRLRAFL